MGITVLGPLDVAGSGTPLGARDRIVVAALAMAPGRTLTAEQLADAVWGDSPPASWRKNVQGCILRVRRALGPEAIETTPHGYRLALTPDQVDAVEFERLLGRARELLVLGEAERAAYVLEQALSLWRGRALPELEEWEPGRIEAARLDEVHHDAEELWLEASLQAGRHREVLARAQALVAAEPMRERRWRLLALAEYRCGRQNEALATLRELREMLLREGGVDLDPESVELGEAILRQDAALDVVATGPGTERSPYLGLSAYDASDAEVFFGRDRDVSACLDRLRAVGVLAVVGPSGLGKSSLLRAGVVPALRHQGCKVAVITPGSRPLDAWPRSPRGHGPDIVVVDQGEEVFTACRDPVARREFLGRAVEHARAGSGPRLVVALRADCMGDLAGHPAFARLVERGLHLLGPMDEEDLRAVIEGPARQAGLVVEPGLVDLLLREVAGEPAALPLLSHSLRETWLRREGHTLTVAGYRASGGIREAVAHTAEEVYERLDTHQRELLRGLFGRLVAPGNDGGPVLSPVPHAVAKADPEQQEMVDTLIAARILTSDEDTVRLTHEAIVEAWPRLRRWLEEDLEGRRILHHLAGAAEAWDGLGRPESELYRGARLRRVLAWADRSGPDLAPVERDLLAASREHAAAEQRATEQRAREQVRMIRRLRIVLTGAVLLLVAALVATGLAAQQRGVADRRASEASHAETRAVARAAGSAALVTDDVDESLLLAVAGVRLDDSVDTRRSLLAAIGRFPALYSSTPLPGDDQVVQLDVSRRGGLLATMDYRQQVRVYAAGSGELLAERQVAPSIPVVATRDKVLKFSPDGTMLAVGAIGGDRPPVQLLDARTLSPLPVRLGMPRGPGWIGADLAFSRDGHHLAAALRRQQPTRRGPGDLVSTAAVALVWDIPRGGEPRRFALHDLDWQSVALSPHGSRLYTSTPLVEHDLVHGGSRVLDDRAVGMLTLGRGGRVMATVLDGRAVVEDLGTGRTTSLDSGLDVAEVRLAGDGRTLVLVEWNERTAEVWHVGDGKPWKVTDVDLDRGAAAAVAFSADGTSLYSATGGSALRRWDLTGTRQFVRRDAVAGERRDAAFAVMAPGGNREVFIPLGGEGVAVHDLRTGEQSRTMPWGNGYRHTVGAWHPDGRHYATAAGRHLRVWDLKTARRVDQAVLPGPRVAEIDYSPDGSRLFVAELGGRISMLSTRTWDTVGRPVDVGEHVSWVQAGPDDRTAVVLTGGLGGRNLIAESPGWALLDLADGMVEARGSLGMAHGTWLGISPDGRYAAVAGGSIAENVDVTGADGKLAVIDLQRGELVRRPVVAHQGVAWQLAYSPDGSRILTTGLDGTVALWDATSGTLLGRVTVDGRPYAGVAFTPDGRSARIVEWWSGRTWTWPLGIDAALAHACRAAGRELTREEWRDHFGHRPYVHVCDP